MANEQEHWNNMQICSSIVCSREFQYGGGGNFLNCANIMSEEDCEDYKREDQKNVIIIYFLIIIFNNFFLFSVARCGTFQPQKMVCKLIKVACPFTSLNSDNGEVETFFKSF